VFARKLRINERTLEKWEQGRAKPNPQAAALVLLERRYPDTLERLEKRWRPVDAIGMQKTHEIGKLKLEDSEEKTRPHAVGELSALPNYRIATDD
jgi:transcriptional regulator with XRE-family HTH domain